VCRRSALLSGRMSHELACWGLVRAGLADRLEGSDLKPSARDRGLLRGVLQDCTRAEAAGVARQLALLGPALRLLKGRIGMTEGLEDIGPPHTKFQRLREGRESACRLAW
jgi:hypothetical protein